MALYKQTGQPLPHKDFARAIYAPVLGKLLRSEPFAATVAIIRNCVGSQLKLNCGRYTRD